jgi:beta-alanine--pyruvate transaminase
MGGMILKREIHEAIMQGPAHVFELFQSDTYPGHPLAGAAALDLYREEGLFDSTPETKRR